MELRYVYDRTRWMNDLVYDAVYGVRYYWKILAVHGSLRVVNGKIRTTCGQLYRSTWVTLWKFSIHPFNAVCLWWRGCRASELQRSFEKHWMDEYDLQSRCWWTINDRWMQYWCDHRKVRSNERSTTHFDPTSEKSRCMEHYQCRHGSRAAQLACSICSSKNSFRYIEA